MPRQPRLDAPGTVHHVWARGLDRRAILLDAADCGDMLARMSRVLPESSVPCYVWCFIPNHTHAVLQSGEKGISSALRRIHTGFAVYFNHRYERTGYVFQSRFGSRVVRDDADLATVILYVCLNPPRAGIVSSLEELERYPWCSYGAMMGRRRAHPFEAVDEALAVFDARVEVARERMREAMAHALDAAGDGSVAAAPNDEVRHLVELVCRVLGAPPSDLYAGRRSKRVSDARAIVCHLAVEELGVAGRDVAAALGMTEAAVTRARGRGRMLAVAEGIEPTRTRPRANWVE
jgi:REP element-mobilizing transposase RayT